ncbi:MAG TPA: hypothetical protein VMB71_05960 [Acetobacteraceae bacterium]|nr:hypothetical protein [Acetobacteraceae bacterium]
MGHTTITTLVSTTVTLGSGGYGSPLTITATGGVAPTMAGADAIIVPAARLHGRIINDGKVGGASGLYGGSGSGGSSAGGIGIDLAGIATVVNAGQISGGIGGYTTLQSGYNAGYAGGVGVLLATTDTLRNSGTITGGHGNYLGSYHAPIGAGGTGVAANGAASIDNTGLIAGGKGGKGYGGGSYYSGGNGGVGVLLTEGGDLSNHGTITGGLGGYSKGYYYGAGTGGAGVSTEGAAHISNKGLIEGGGGDGPGVGVDLGAGGTLTNAGTIAGGGGFFAYDGISGAAGVSVASGDIVMNSGKIIGGGGGEGYYFGGTGGDGVICVAGATIINSGQIIGGEGGLSYYYGVFEDGGAGVYLHGGTVTNAGTISGGSGPNDAYNDSVQFGALAGTLIVDPGAVFIGAVVANAAVDDVLRLAGTRAGTLTGQFTNFTTVTEVAGANWQVDGTITLGADAQLTDGGQLTVGGTVADAGLAKILDTGDLRTENHGTLQVGSLTLQGGYLEDAPTAAIAIGGGTVTDGVISIAAGATAEGYGTIAGGPISNDGRLVADGGTLTVESSAAGTGTMRIDSGATMIVDGTLTVTHVAFDQGGDATLALAVPIPTTGPTPLFYAFGTGDLIDIHGIDATSGNFAAGTLTLYDGTKVVDALKFSGTYDTANFDIASDGQGGTAISFVPDGADASARTYPHFDFGAHDKVTATSLGLAEMGGSHHFSDLFGGESPWTETLHFGR